MFELSDDEDEHFWDDIPLHDVADMTSTNNNKNNSSTKPQLRVPESNIICQPAKKLCTEGSLGRRDLTVIANRKSELKENEQATTIPCSDLKSRKSSEGTQQRETLSSNENKNRSITSHQSGPVSGKRSPNEDNDVRNMETSFSDDYITPKRKRKFPGPAGVLPKLMPGQSIDIGLHTSTTETGPKEKKSPHICYMDDVYNIKKAEETTLLSSQSSENLFMDDPWQALLKDIGDEGLGVMKKFSIASTLLKAGKKQLYQGKAWLVFGVIESIENHGTEASASIKDRSGRMHGTIHNDLMTEYDAELQAGTVLVLKQVSIISLSNKNHYLNITPNNLVSLYHIKENTLKSLHFHGSQDSLHSVLKSLERESTTRRQSTPDSLLSGSRRSSTGSGSSTPVMSMGTPDIQSMNKRLFNTHSSGYSTNANNSVTAVRDVSVIPRTTRGIPPSINNTHCSTPVDNRHKSSMVTKTCAIAGNNSTSSSFNRTVQQTPSSSLDVNQQNNRTNVSTTPKWRFRSTSSAVSSPVVSSHNVNFNVPHTSSQGVPSKSSSVQSGNFIVNNRLSSTLNQGPVTLGRTCQLQVSTSNIDRSKDTVGHLSTKTFMTQGTNNTNESQEKVVNQSSSCVKESDLWEDDLSDEILSQLTDDFT